MSNSLPEVDMIRLREAIEASWDSRTSYRGVLQPGNPALGQCYVTACAVQHFFPQFEIVEGYVWTGKISEHHFWNVLVLEDGQYHLDWTWQQFPPGSRVEKYQIRDRQTYNDSQATIERRELLISRVVSRLAKQ